MNIYNLHNILKIKVSKDLPYLAKKSIKELFSFYTGSINYHKITLNIENYTTKHENLIKNDSFNIDCFQKVQENAFYENCVYKFAHWEYLLYRHSKSNWTLAVKGNFASGMVWPCRTLINLVNLFLGTNDCYSIHAASFYTEKGAVLLVAPSGTGKTLTTLHWICSNRKFYDDDTTTILRDTAIPTVNSVGFWGHRYKGNLNVFPKNFPKFKFKTKTHLYFNNILEKLTLGYVGLACQLNINDYFPNSIAPKAKIYKIISIIKGREFKLVNNSNKQIIKNKLIGDLMYQNLSIVRWNEVMKLTGSNLLPTKLFFDNYTAFINKILKDSTLINIEVPPKYSSSLFNNIKNLIEK